ncbi:MAG: EAL domain-containing protein [Actinobacteria bacterium]|nr:EAL domain-containing protein [Actinomycetota bacterium]
MIDIAPKRQHCPDDHPTGDSKPRGDQPETIEGADEVDELLDWLWREAIREEGPATGAGGVGEILRDSLAQVVDPVGVFAWPGGTVRWANHALITRSTRGGPPEWSLLHLLDEWSQAHFLVRALPVLLTEGRWRGELRYIDRESNAAAPMATTLVAHRGAFGEIDSIILLAHEEPVAAPSTSAETFTTGPLAALLPHISDLLVVMDPEGSLTYASPAAVNLLALPGGADGSPLGHVLELIHPDDRPADLRRLVAAPSRIRVRAADGGWRHLEAVVTDLRHNRTVGGFVLTARDVTDVVDARRQAAEQAYTDELTGLANRVRLLDRLDGFASGTGAARPVALLLLDLDRLAATNQRYGRATGDRVLVEVARRVKAWVDSAWVDGASSDGLDGSGALVARLRSDELVVVVPGLTEPDRAEAIGDDLRAAVAAPLDVHGEMLSVTTSVGVAFRRPGEPVEAMLADADRAVRRAKSAGRDRTVVHDADAVRADQHRRTFDHQLRQVLAADGLLLHYQPIVAVERDEIVGAEALLRLRGSTGELLNPGTFVDAAESTGLIARLGAEVLRTTSRELASSGLDVSVNVSPRQISAAGFADAVVAILADSDLALGRLCLEITEGAILSQSDQTEANIMALRERGVRVGIDEMGSGRTSIAALRRFPLDFVKLDRSLVAGLGANYVDGAIVRSTVELAHQLGLAVVAVGVESEQQLECLRLLGCDLVQGHLFAAALEIEQLLARVRLATPPHP